MRVTQEAIDLLKASAGSNLRARWLVAERATGLVVSTATLCRPYVNDPKLLVVGVVPDAAR